MLLKTQYAKISLVLGLITTLVCVVFPILFPIVPAMFCIALLVPPGRRKTRGQLEIKDRIGDPRLIWWVPIVWSLSVGAVAAFVIVALAFVGLLPRRPVLDIGFFANPISLICSLWETQACSRDGYSILSIFLWITGPSVTCASLYFLSLNRSFFFEQVFTTYKSEDRSTLVLVFIVVSSIASFVLISLFNSISEFPDIFSIQYYNNSEITKIHIQYYFKNAFYAIFAPLMYLAAMISFCVSIHALMIATWWGYEKVYLKD